MNRSKPLRVGAVTCNKGSHANHNSLISGTKQIFTSMPKAGDAPTIGAFKLIILDEADAMTSVAQMALRRIMEKYTANTRFCIIANYTHKLSPALLSRCTRFRFSPLKEPDIKALVDLVIEKEEVKIQPEAVESLVRLSKGDMRRALNVLQACHASSQLTHDDIFSTLTNLSRHTPPHQGPTETRRCVNKTRNDHQRNNLRLHRGSPPLRYPNNPLHPPLYL